MTERCEGGHNTPLDIERQTGVSANMLRSWRHQGFLVKLGFATAGGHWRYTDNEVNYLALVRKCEVEYGLPPSLGFSLSSRLLREIEAELGAVKSAA